MVGVAMGAARKTDCVAYRHGENPSIWQHGGINPALVSLVHLLIMGAEQMGAEVVNEPSQNSECQFSLATPMNSTRRSGAESVSRTPLMGRKSR